MKRLLLSQGRTGSLNLTRFIREANKTEITVFREPFNTTAVSDTNIYYSLQNILKEENCFVENKIGKGSLPSELNTESYDDIIIFLKKNFAKIAFLSRRNSYNQIQSIINAKVSKVWDSKYFYKEYDIEKFSDVEKQIEYEKNIINYLSSKYNLPVFYYEDLYDNNTSFYLKDFCSYFNLQYKEEIANSYMNSDNKYRLNESKKVL